MLKILVLFSNPPGTEALRLGREDRLVAELARRHADRVRLERHHASEVASIHAILLHDDYDVIQFSGHGNAGGIFLEKGDIDAGEFVTPARLIDLINLSPRTPRLVILMCCYSDGARQQLLDLAPFVITAEGSVPDQHCLTFIEGLYERLFGGESIERSFRHAESLLRSHGVSTRYFNLTRRCVQQVGTSKLIQSTPCRLSGGEFGLGGTIWINIDAIADDISRLDLSEEELCHLLSKKIMIHTNIFRTPREKCVLPLGGTFYGEFSWTDAHDVIRCTKLMRLRAGAPAARWKLWATHLTMYNDLAASGYRRPNIAPCDPSNQRLLHQAADRLRTVCERLENHREAMLSLGLHEAISHLEFIRASGDNADEKLQAGELDDVVVALEIALTHYHELVDVLQPPEE